eukprot:gene28049-34846_t
MPRQPSRAPTYSLSALTQIATVVGSGLSNSTVVLAPATSTAFDFIRGVCASGGDGGPATSARINGMFGVCGDSMGNVYIGEAGGDKVRKVTVSGGANTISTIMGTGTAGVPIEGAAATSTPINDPFQIYVDSVGHVYTTLQGVSKILVLSEGLLRTAAGTRITTVFGTGYAARAGDGGPASSASMNNPRGLWADTSGTMFVSELTGGRIRRVDGVTNIVSLFAGSIRQVDPQHIITTIAGGSGATSGVDGRQATSTTLSTPNQYTYKIRQINLNTGILTTAVGRGSVVWSNKAGPASSIALAQPAGVYADVNGNLFITEGLGNSVKMLHGGIVTTIAGSGVASNTSSVTSSSVNTWGDGGPPTAATLNNPVNAFVNTNGGNKIRKLYGTLTPTVTPSSAPSSRPSSLPSRCPSSQPSRRPSSQPSRYPSSMPSVQPI